ncbi:hypothetical protein EG328_010710 [Venturia inaequalis]|uniref:Uncharacterized protein n=1 Tax=Venturia inaequalis TaxID=5025 RepID=A0A8H3U6Y4_VENIN|nr:hypothetical protein EG328_010710 [Venturia inaequalis]
MSYASTWSIHTMIGFTTFFFKTIKAKPEPNETEEEAAKRLKASIEGMYRSKDTTTFTDSLRHVSSFDTRVFEDESERIELEERRAAVSIIIQRQKDKKTETKLEKKARLEVEEEYRQLGIVLR